MYLTYLALSVGLTVWVGRTLYRNGEVFLIDVFAQNERLAKSVNHLLVVGFYLVNLGYVSLALRTSASVPTPEAAIEVLSWKIGLVMLVLGGMHFMNMIVFAKSRRRAIDDRVREEAAAAARERSAQALAATLASVPARLQTIVPPPVAAGPSGS
jgi:hypothetical protein